MVKKVKDLSDEEVNNLSHGDFVIWFVKFNNKVINRYARRRLIPNRYSVDDIKSYIIERILDILQKRELKMNPIKEPRLYFRKLIDFYCIEYQRMHGYIYGMPKRPRCPEAEAEISKYGFTYLNAKTLDHTRSLHDLPQLAYIDTHVDSLDKYSCYAGGKSFPVKGQDPDIVSDAWKNIMDMALPEDRKVLTCLFRQNMSVPEVSKYLNIAISTAYARRDRGLKAISGTLATFVDLDKDSWQILNDVTDLDHGKISIDNFYKVKDSPTKVIKSTVYTK